MAATSLALTLCAAFAQQPHPAAQEPAPQASQPATEILPLRILYAGNTGTPYTAAWMAFLDEHVASVRFVAGRALSAKDLTDIDVLVVDGEVEQRDATGAMQSLKSEHIRLGLGDLQGFPVVLMGGEGGFLSDELKLKTSWHHG